MRVNTSIGQRERSIIIWQCNWLHVSA